MTTFQIVAPGRRLIVYAVQQISDYIPYGEFVPSTYLMIEAENQLMLRENSKLSTDSKSETAEVGDADKKQELIPRQ